MAMPIGKIDFGDLVSTLKVLAKIKSNAGHMEWTQGKSDEASARWLLAAIEEKMSIEAAQRGAAEESRRIVIINSGYTGEYANERCNGPYGDYPGRWTPKSAVERAKILAPHFPGIDFSHVEALADHYQEGSKKVCGLLLPKYADGGLLVFPKLEAFRKCIRKRKSSWRLENIAMEYLLGVFKELFPSFYDCTKGKVGPEYERLLDLTARKLLRLDAETPGDVHVVPLNGGALFAGYSVQSSRGHMQAFENHLPATDIMTFCRAMSDPESFENGSLVADCSGTETAPNGDGNFYSAPCLYLKDGGFKFRSCSISNCHPDYGSSSLVLPVVASSR